MSLNHMVLTGKVADPGPKLTYSTTSAKPECRLTLVIDEGKGEQVFSLYVPVVVYGAGAERTAEDVDAGDLIAVDGRLGWKSTLKKDGTKLGLCVTTFGVEVLVKAEVPVAAGGLETNHELEPVETPSKTMRKPRYPKWKPTPAESAN
jgi:single-stranded DNA-binding protein